MDIDDELEPLTVHNYDVSPGMDNLIRHVLKIIPDSYSEEFPSFSVFETCSSWEAHVERETLEEVAIVYLDRKCLDMPRDVAVGTLAHEFAHVFLEHSGNKAGLPEEDEADKLACQWGFTREIEAMRQYHGPPTNS
jgi:hypothetical protein